jgi:hypothetical protein
MKIIWIALLIILVFFDYMMILVGSHGNFQFRPWMTEDWFFFGILLLTWGTAAILIFISLYEKIKNFLKSC